MYSSGASGRLTIYYQTSPDTAPERITAAAAVSDGQWHRLLVVMGPTSATVAVDGNTVLASPLAGPPLDCGARSEDCVTWLGRRAATTGSAGFPMAGEVMHARVYEGAFDTIPDDVHPDAVLNMFAEFPNQYLQGNNDLGAFRSGVTVQGCAARCRAIAGCFSFDAGLPGTSSNGACYLSSLRRDSAGAVLRTSANFGFYELL